MSNGEQFDGIGMALGVVTGARSFKVDKLGRLTGIHYDQVWTPGENVCECRKKEGASGGTYTVRMVPDYRGFTLSPYTNYQIVTDAYAAQVIASTSAPTLPATVDPKPIEKKKVKPKPHSMGDCACGFYGYYDGSNDYYQKGYVAGVVEGYGEALIGTRGFRVSKARIVALRIPANVPAPLAALVRRNYAAIPQFEKFGQMVAAFPCDGGELAVSPETDEDFWTRSA